MTITQLLASEWTLVAMSDAERRRDAALRRLRRVNRGGAVASVAGVVVVMGLAHQATPVGKTRHAVTQVVRSTISDADAAAKSATRGAATKHRITPAPAPTAARSGSQTTQQPTSGSSAAASNSPADTAAPAPVTSAPAPVTSAPAPATNAPATVASTPAPVVSGAS